MHGYLGHTLGPGGGGKRNTHKGWNGARERALAYVCMCNAYILVNTHTHTRDMCTDAYASAFLSAFQQMYSRVRSREHRGIVGARE